MKLYCHTLRNQVQETLNNLTRLNTHSGNKELMVQLQEGNRNAYRQLCSQCFDQLFRYVQGSVKSRQLTEMILEDAFIEIWQKKASLNIEVAFKDQLLLIVESMIIEVLCNSATMSEFLKDEVEKPCLSIKEEIWRWIRKLQEITIVEIFTTHKDKEPVLKVIQNNRLQHQLLHQLATTRR